MRTAVLCVCLLCCALAAQAVPSLVQRVSEHAYMVLDDADSWAANWSLDITHQVSKSLPQVPNLEFYQVFVSFDMVAHKALTPAPARGVGLDWAMPEPDQVQGPPEAVRAAYEAAFTYISTHIRDLVQAILGIDLEPGKINGK